MTALPPPPSTPPGSPGRRGLLWAILVVLVVLTLVVGGLALTLALRGPEGGGTPADPPAGPAEDTRREAVEEQPDKAWEWETEGPAINYVAADDELVIVNLEDGQGFVVLDPDGEELWRDDSEPWIGAYASSDGPIIATFSRKNGVYRDVMFDHDGKRLWSSKPGDSYWGQLDDGGYLLRNDDGFRKVDPATGEVQWRIDGEVATWHDERVMAVTGDKVTSYDIKDGSQVWSAELPEGHRGGDEDPYPVISANDEFVLVSTGTLTAFSHDGEQLWAEPDAGSLLRAVGDRYLVTPRYDDPDQSGPYPLYGVEGKVAEVDPELADGDIQKFWLTRVVVDGVEMNFDQTNGILYDADGDLVERGYADVDTVVHGGVYTLSGSTVGYRRWGEAEPEWDLTLDDVDSVADVFSDDAPDLRLGSTSGAIYLSDRDTVWRYE